MNRNFFGMTGGAAVVLVFFGALGVGCTATVGQQAAGEVVGGLLCLVIGLPVGLTVASYLEHRADRRDERRSQTRAQQAEIVRPVVTNIYVANVYADGCRYRLEARSPAELSRLAREQFGPGTLLELDQ